MHGGDAVRYLMDEMDRGDRKGRPYILCVFARKNTEVNPVTPVNPVKKSPAMLHAERVFGAPGALPETHSPWTLVIPLS